VRYYAPILFLLLTLSASSAQWTDFDLSPAVGSRFARTAQPLLRGTALALGYQPLYSRADNQRTRLGISYLYVHDFPGTGLAGQLRGFPLVEGVIVVTDNLYLSGGISGFTSRNDVIQVTAVGLNLFLTQAAGADWHFVFRLARLDGAEDLRLRVTDFNLRKELQVAAVPLLVGFGSSTYRSRIRLRDDTHPPPTRLEGAVNYVEVGTRFTLGGFSFRPQLRLHPEVLLVSLDLMRGFR
jgi:hypothetical protein